jgi:hypothetical protein
MHVAPEITGNAPMFNLRGDGDVDDFVLGWKCPALLPTGFETELDRFLNVRERFFAGTPLTDASGDYRGLPGITGHSAMTHPSSPGRSTTGRRMQLRMREPGCWSQPKLRALPNRRWGQSSPGIPCSDFPPLDGARGLRSRNRREVRRAAARNIVSIVHAASTATRSLSPLARTVSCSASCTNTCTG